jgi:vesicle transport protein SEC22
MCLSSFPNNDSADPRSYLIVDKVIYMCICDANYPRKLAFSYLDELSKEFQTSYGDKIETVNRPYAFMGFGRSLRYFHLHCPPSTAACDFACAYTTVDTFISKTTRLYRDSRTLQGSGTAPGPSSQLDQLNENLKDVTRIMTKNMEDLLWRGDSLDRMSMSYSSTRHLPIVFPCR